MNLSYYEAVNFGNGTWINRWVEARQVKKNWNALQATKDKRVTSLDTSWLATYGALDGTDVASTYESTVLFWQNEALPKWKLWDLTALTQKWLNNTAPNYGVMLRATNEDSAGYAMRLYSSEASPAFYQPYLEVIYSTDAAIKTVYFLKDHLGSIRAAVLDSTGAPLVGFDDYDPWGYPLAQRAKAIPAAYLQGASKSKFIGMQLDDDYGLNLHHTPFRPYDGLIGRWVVRDPLALKYPSQSPYNYGGNNPVVMIDPNGTDWFYYQAEGEDAATWRYHEGKTATYTNTQGKKVTTNKGYEYLVKYTVTGKNDEGAETGKLEVYKQNERVVNVEGAFTGGGGNPAVPGGTYIMRLDVRDDKGPQGIRLTPSGPSPDAHWGIQLIPNRFIEGYDVGGAYGGGRIRLNPVDSNLRIRPELQINAGYFLHGKYASLNYTHGCVCDRSEAVFNYFWSGPGKQYNTRVPFWVKK